MKTSKLCSVIFLALVLVLFVAPARATITLSDSDSVVLIDPTSSAGIYSWSVDGVNQLAQQWYWYRIGATGVAQSIDNLGLLSIVQALPDQATLSYGSATGLEVILKLTLDGGPVGSGLGDLDTQVQIDNHASATTTVHFFEYNNFELNGVTGGQSVTLTGTPVNSAIQSNGLTSLAEEVAGPAPEEYEAALTPVILNGLNTVSGYTLNDTATAGPGDATWAFEWDKTLGHNGAYLLSKDESLSVVVPEPATIFGMGVILLAVGRKLRKTRV
ncbi:MAG: PEP-CTERM sorting domain-containing protein [Bryobacteraceae bacterium]|jgi:hypothetical protein